MIYLDHAATTPMSEGAMRVYHESAMRYFGNPSSLHAAGRAAKAALEEARAQIAALMGCAPSEILFTSGGSEGDNLAIAAGIARANAHREGQNVRGRLVASAMEHPAVLSPLAAYRAQGGEVTLLAPSERGILSPDRLAPHLDGHTALVSVMAANNETGILQPWRQIAALCASRGIPYHVDAVQTMGRVDMTLPAEGALLLTASAHKFGGPRGVGFLVARGVALRPMLLGGGQETGRRAGTENLPAICAMAYALKEWHTEREARLQRLTALHERLAERLSAIEGCRLTAEAGSALPGHLHATWEGLDGEAILWQMDERGVAISTGSACHAISGAPQGQTLASMGFSQAQIRGAIRITASYTNTLAEAEEATAALSEICGSMRRAMRR